MTCLIQTILVDSTVPLVYTMLPCPVALYIFISIKTVMYESGNRKKDHPMDTYPLQYSCGWLCVWAGVYHSCSLDDGEMGIVSPDRTDRHLALEGASCKKMDKG